MFKTLRAALANVLLKASAAVVPSGYVITPSVLGGVGPWRPK